MDNDILDASYTVDVFDLPDDDEGTQTATLIHRAATAPNDGRAVLHVHGFCDYFFHTEYAEWFNARGYDFFAIDLPKAGRSLRPHHSPNYVANLDEYFPVLDRAWAHVTARFDRVVISAHSTGGLTTPLWVDQKRPGELIGMALNSPWLDLQGSALMRTIGTEVIKHVGRLRPKLTIPRTVNGLYGRALHRDFEGEWDYDLRIKPLESYPVYAGWMRAIRDGHARLHRGLNVPAPVLVLSSASTAWPTEMGEAMFTNDTVLDVAQIRRWATAIGEHVTYAAIPNAIHDIFLSRPAPREHAYGELGQWLAAYVEV